jgi:hypothetical protein
MSKDSAKSPYLTLEELDLFGDMDSLPFSLDDPIWQDRDAAMASSLRGGRKVTRWPLMVLSPPPQDWATRPASECVR